MTCFAHLESNRRIACRHNGLSSDQTVLRSPGYLRKIGEGASVLLLLLPSVLLLRAPPAPAGQVCPVKRPRLPFHKKPSKHYKTWIFSFCRTSLSEVPRANLHHAVPVRPLYALCTARTLVETIPLMEIYITAHRIFTMQYCIPTYREMEINVFLLNIEPLTPLDP